MPQANHTRPSPEEADSRQRKSGQSERTGGATGRSPRRGDAGGECFSREQALTGRNDQVGPTSLTGLNHWRARCRVEHSPELSWLNLIDPAGGSRRLPQTPPNTLSKHDHRGRVARSAPAGTAGRRTSSAQLRGSGPARGPIEPPSGSGPAPGAGSGQQPVLITMNDRAPRTASERGERPPAVRAVRAVSFSLGVRRPGRPGQLPASARSANSSSGYTRQP